MSVQSSSPSSRWIERNALLAFFVLAYLIGWIAIAPRVLASRGLLPPAFSNLLFDLVFVLSPAISALVVTGMTTGRAGARALLSRYAIWRAGLGWYGVALFLPLLLLLGAISVATLLGRFEHAVPPLSDVATGFIAALAFNGISNQEEIGWRGFALPMMQARWTALQASVVLGVVWALWHIPLFLRLDTPNSQLPFAGFLINVLAQAILLTWMFNSTRGSLLLCQLLHQSGNAWAAALVPVPDVNALWIFWVLSLLVAIGVIVVYGPPRLSRQPLQRLLMP